MGLQAGKPFQYVSCNKSPRSTQPSIPPEYVSRVLACLTAVKVGCVHLCRVADSTV